MSMDSGELESRQRLLRAADTMNLEIGTDYSEYESDLAEFHAAVGAYVGAGFRAEPIRRLLLEFAATDEEMFEDNDPAWDERIKAALIEATTR